MRDNAEIAAELSPSPPQRDDSPSAPSHPSSSTNGPPTPQDVSVGGDLQTIDEGSEDDDDDALITASFYAELMSDEPLKEDDTYEETCVYPVQMMPENIVLFMAEDDDQSEYRGNMNLESTEVLITQTHLDSKDYACDKDEIGDYAEICFTSEMSPVILEEKDYGKLKDDEVATMRVYISAEAKRTVVVKEDDLLTRKELIHHAPKVTEATKAEIKIWIENKCFLKRILIGAQNVMTSRYVAKWKWVMHPDGKWTRIIRMRLVLRGFMDTEAFSIDTFSGTARRSSQRLLASESACHPEWIIASLDIDKAFLKGFTYKELAEATGEKERCVCFKLPPGSASILRQFPSFQDYDESKHCLQCSKPGTGTKDAPRAFSMKLKRTTVKFGLKPTSFDPEFEIKHDLATAKHVDDVNCTGVEKVIDAYQASVEKVFGKCKSHKHEFTNCGVRYKKDASTDYAVIMDQDEYIKTLRPIVSPELTGASADKEATKAVSDLFVSLRGALAYTVLTQAWIQVYVVALQRVQQPTNIDVRRLNAITRKLQKEPQKLIFPAMTCVNHIDIHTDSGYRRIESADDVKGYGMYGLCLLRRGKPLATKRANRGDTNLDTSREVIHLLESLCKSHRLTIRSSYGAETIAASHGFDASYPTLITLVELKFGVLRPEQLKLYREEGGLALKVILTTDAESVFKSISSRDLKTPAEKTLLSHIAWIRELLKLKLLEAIQWCDTRDMVADGHTKGSIDRDMLLKLMKGQQSYAHEVKSYQPLREQAQVSKLVA